MSRDELLVTFLKGTVEAPLKSRAVYELDPPTNDGAGTWVFAPPAGTDEDVDAERDRRIEAGNGFTLSTETVIAITRRKRDKAVLMSQFLAV